MFPTGLKYAISMRNEKLTKRQGFPTSVESRLWLLSFNPCQGDILKVELMGEGVFLMCKCGIPQKHPDKCGWCIPMVGRYVQMGLWLR